VRYLLVALALCACGQKKPPPSGPVLGDGGVGMTLRETNLSHNHLATCDDPNCGNGMNPPLGGDHCPTWLNCRVFDTAQPKCNWIHNLEHGALVMVYNCNGAGCDAFIQQLKDYQVTHTDALVTPDPDLPDVAAVMVWGFGWLGNGFNQAAFDEVASHQGAESPEHIACSP
jgi:hypothetical protein